MVSHAANCSRVLQYSVKYSRFRTIRLAYPLCYFTGKFEAKTYTAKTRSIINPLPVAMSIHTHSWLFAGDSGINREITDNWAVKQAKQREMKGSDPEKFSHFRATHSLNKLSLTEDNPSVEKITTTPIWTKEETEAVEITHESPRGWTDTMAFYTVHGLKLSFDFLSGCNRKVRDETVWLNRICMLETVASVPGMVAAMVRHLDSVRRMNTDHGWIHTLIEQAENEHMHLLLALELRKPNWLYKMAVTFTQVIMVPIVSLAYILSPRFCHRLVGYLEEEAVCTYSACLEDIEKGNKMSHWKRKAAPNMAKKYWNLDTKATMKDVILAIRADDAHHRSMNHTMAGMKRNENPYKDPQFMEKIKSV